MEIEVAQPNGVFLKAKVQAVSQDGINVVYNSDWAAPELATFDRCRVLLAKNPSSSNHIRFEVESMVEAYIKQPDSEIYGWQKGKIRDIKDNFAVVDAIEGPSNSGILFIELCRPADQTTPLSFALYQIHRIDVPLDMLSYFEDPKACSALCGTVKDVHAKFMEEERCIVVTSFSEYAIRCVRILEDPFMSMAKQKKIVMDQLAELMKPTGVGKYVEEFNVPGLLIGLAIGKNGSNIANARNIPGIVDLFLDKSRQVSAGVCRFKVVAETAEALHEARQMLEFVYSALTVPSKFVGQIVGKQGRIMQEIVNQSGALKVEIGCENESDELDDGDVELVFTGTRESFNFAKLLVEMRVKQITELDAIRSDINAIKDKSSNSLPSLHNGRRPSFSQQARGTKHPKKM